MREYNFALFCIQVRGISVAHRDKLFEEFKVNKPVIHDLVVSRDRGTLAFLQSMLA